MESSKLQLVTKREAAKILSCCPKTIERAVAAGLIRQVDLKQGRGQRITPRYRVADIEKFVGAEVDGNPADGGGR